MGLCSVEGAFENSKIGNNTASIEVLEALEGSEYFSSSNGVGDDYIEANVVTVGYYTEIIISWIHSTCDTTISIC